MICTASMKEAPLNKVNMNLKRILLGLSGFLAMGMLAAGLLEATPKLRVMATVFPLEEFARVVGGNRVQVDSLLPAGAEPHTWEPKPSDVIKISRVDIFLSIGVQMEPWVHDILAAVGKSSLQVIQASQVVTTIHRGQRGPGGKEPGEPGQGALDPHVWLDFENDRQIVDALIQAFSRLDPGGENLFQRNGQEYKRKLAELDAKYRRVLGKCGHRQLIFGGHAAFAYLARRYNLEQISLYGTSPDSHPTPRRVAEVASRAREHQVQAIYVDPFVSDKMARVLASEVGAEVLVLNPAGNLTRQQRQKGISFLTIMEQNLANLKRGLVCE